MNPVRAGPYSQFNFLVAIGADADSPQAGFEAISGLGTEITVAEYRSDNTSANAVRKVTGASKFPDVTLKRGMIRALYLHNWLQDMRAGSHNATRDVMIKRLNEDRTETLQTWRLIKARPLKYTGPALQGTGPDVAIEELVLACEAIDID